MSASRPPDLQRLAQIALDDAAAQTRREENRALAEARRVVIEAQDHIDELRRAAQSLGETRGGAAVEALEREADAEIAAVYATANQGLEERFLRRLRLALEGLRSDRERHARAVVHWAGLATAAMQGRPSEVFCARRDRSTVYEALRAAGATDFQVRGDPRVNVGFVVRDLDGRTQFDARPDGRIEAEQDTLLEMLRAHVQTFQAPAREA